MTVSKESAESLNALLGIQDGKCNANAAIDSIKLFLKPSPDATVSQALVDARETTLKQMMAMKPKNSSFKTCVESPEQSFGKSKAMENDSFG